MITIQSSEQWKHQRLIDNRLEIISAPLLKLLGFAIKGRNLKRMEQLIIKFYFFLLCFRSFFQSLYSLILYLKIYFQFHASFVSFSFSPWTSLYPLYFLFSSIFSLFYPPFHFILFLFSYWRALREVYLYD